MRKGATNATTEEAEAAEQVGKGAANKPGKAKVFAEAEGNILTNVTQNVSVRSLEEGRMST